MSIYNRSPSENRGFFEIIGDGLGLLKKNYLKIVFPLFIFSMIPIVLNVFLTTWLEAITINIEPRVNTIIENMVASGDFSGVSQSDISIVLQYLLASMLSLVLDYSIVFSFEIFGISLLAYHLYKEFTGQEADLAEDMKKSLNYRLIPVILILGPLMALGLFIFIGSLIVFGLFIYLIYTYNMPEYEDGGYIKKSRKIGSFFKKVGVFLITIIVVHFVIDLTFESIILSIWNIDYETISVWITTGNYAMLLLYQAITGIPRALLYGPLLVCLLTSLFAEDLKEYRIETGSQQFYMEREETRGQEPSKLKEGMFCPFCGAKINEKQNYCPKCGESLDFIT